MEVIQINAFNDKVNSFGFGLLFEPYCITLNHIIKGYNIRDFNELYEINPYDLCFLIRDNINANDDIKMNLIQIFRKRIIGLDFYKIDEILQFIESREKFNVSVDDFNFNFRIIDIVCQSVNSIIMPEIPMIRCQIIGDPFNLNGLSGYTVMKNNKIIGMIKSTVNDEYGSVIIDMIPFDIISILIQNEITSSDIPFLNIKYKKCKILNERNEKLNVFQVTNRKVFSDMSFKKDTFIVEVDGMKFNKEFKLKFKNIDVDFNTYVLLKHELDLIILNNNDIYTRHHINVEKITTKKLAIKTVSCSKLKQVRYLNYVFCEINEDFIFEMVKKGLVINKKLNMNLQKLLDSNLENNIYLLNYDTSDNIYFLNKIGNVNIKYIEMIERYKNPKPITLRDMYDNVINI
jgi:hypothetical protein